MSNSPDPFDVRLREYAARWRAAEPSPPSVDLTRLAARPRRWIAPVIAAVATGLVLFIGLVLLRPGLVRDEPVSPVPPVESTTATGMVAWLPLEPGFASMPAVTIPPSPDPSAAANLPACRADQLSAERSADAATGMQLLFVTFSTTGSGCALDGRPQVTAHGTADIPVEPGVWEDDYGYPVRVAGADLAVLTLSWVANWCAATVTNDRIDLVLPSGGGTIEIAGFGESSCRFPEGPAGVVPIRVGTFQPQEYTPERVATAFADAQAEMQLPADASIGSTLRFAVTLTAFARDVVLSPCPDYAIDVSREPDDADSVGYQLNCGGVPYRDPAGRPYLPADTPVRFAMELVIPDLPGTHKVTWRLEVPDLVMAGSSLVIH